MAGESEPIQDEIIFESVKACQLDAEGVRGQVPLDVRGTGVDPVWRESPHGLFSSVAIE